MKKHLEVNVLVLACVAAVDQLTKIFVADLYRTYGNIELCKFLNLIQVWNKGIGFGIFGTMEYSNTVFTCVSLMIVLVMLVIMLRLGNCGSSLCVAMIIGGALGNILDRLRLGAVYDFIDVHVGRWHWPTFNLADAFVTCGVIIFLLLEVGKTPDPSKK